MYQAQLQHKVHIVELEKLVADRIKEMQPHQKKNDQEIIDLQAKLLAKDEELLAFHKFHDYKCAYLHRLIDEKQEVQQQAPQKRKQEVLELLQRHYKRMKELEEVQEQRSQLLREPEEKLQMEDNLLQEASR